MNPYFSGVPCNTWKVEYQRKNICAVKGSSIVILCSFDHPDHLTVKRVLWVHVKSYHTKGRLSDSNLKKGTTRFQYVGGKRHNCSLKIHQVDHSDAGKYTVRFLTYNKRGRLPGGGSPTLKVIGKSLMAFSKTATLTCNLQNLRL